MGYFTIISTIFMCIIIDTITAQVTKETNNESIKTMKSYQGYQWPGGHLIRKPEIIIVPIIPCPSGQQHDSHELIGISWRI
ncbi:hypothetical protein HZH68_014081 [Vespula germanica]|uniref:Uncharacterized protein n=1 Tax=Vespula germanica TaxID=30212 RepID=A0A834MUS9_VESGE|nr:hypothetical protein HZH68_014081 [Vespula germanica]